MSDRLQKITSSFRRKFVVRVVRRASAQLRRSMVKKIEKSSSKSSEVVRAFRADISELLPVWASWLPLKTSLRHLCHLLIPRSTFTTKKLKLNSGKNYFWPGARRHDWRNLLPRKGQHLRIETTLLRTHFQDSWLITVSSSIARLCCYQGNLARKHTKEFPLHPDR